MSMSLEELEAASAHVTSKAAAKAEAVEGEVVVGCDVEGAEEPDEAWEDENEELRTDLWDALGLLGDAMKAIDDVLAAKSRGMISLKQRSRLSTLAVEIDQFIGNYTADVDIEGKEEL